MSRLGRFFAIAFFASIACVSNAAEHKKLAADPKPGEVDKLFAKWNKPDTPGAAIAILREGKIIYSRGYGLANLEFGVRNTPDTVFHVASVSKQFTAFAIHMLAQQGKISLDDDVRKYVPELHDYGTPLTIRQLLHHTSGVRDQWALLGLAGWRLSDVITQDDVLGLLTRQKALNFPPGERHLYSNSGYTLLGLVVQRVSGQSLAQFTQDQMFKPLGMTRTHFQERYQTVVKDRAYSYAPLEGGGYQYVALSYSTVGPSSLFTTVRDLARWDENFYSGQVGGKAVLSAMQEKGKLNSGQEISYASGLIVEKYRGLNIVWHNGGDAAYRTNILRFPDQHFSVIVLANAGDMDPTTLSQRVADIYLADKLTGPVPGAVASPVKPVEASIDPKLLDGFTGNYKLDGGPVLVFSKEEGKLFAQATNQSKVPVFPSAPNEIFWKVVDARFTFDKPGEDGTIAGGTLHQGGRNFAAHKLNLPPLTAESTRDYVGEFYSDELNVLYTVSFQDGRLMLRHPRGTAPIQQIAADTFTGGVGELRFVRGADGRCTGLSVNNGRVQDLRFVKGTFTASTN